MRSGELFAGVGGLGMAVDEVFGSTPGYFAEFDAAPSKVLAHRYPDVPNLGDVTRIDFRAAPHTEIRCGGFPCQDVSLAGRRRGMKGGTRSGLWSEFARSIQEDRPDWVVIENVRGLLSADASGGDMEPCPLCVGDDPEHVLRALGAVLGDLADLGFDAEWTGLRAADVGAPHGRFRVFLLAWPSENTNGGRGRRGSATSVDGPRAWSDAAFDRSNPRFDRRSPAPLLPTPVVNDMGDGKSPEWWDAWTSKMQAAHCNGNGHGPSLAIEAQRVAAGEVDWAEYEDAVRLWTGVIGRAAPSPASRDNSGKASLNPQLTEWMMGWPAGWVTDPAIGLTPREQRKCAGNGVVPQQAAAALRRLLARPGVPALVEAVVA